jgi:hypothetical protein
MADASFLMQVKNERVSFGLAIRAPFDGKPLMLAALALAAATNKGVFWV